MERVATIDFETRSACSLRACGSWAYSMHPTTEITCMAWRLPQWAPGRTALWHPEFRHLDIQEASCTADFLELCAWIQEGRPVEAHGAWFERGIWTNIAVPKLGWPAISPYQWRCTAAKAAAHTLPRGLDGAGTVLDLDEQKDMEASKSVMMKHTKPRKPRKAERFAWAVQHAGCVRCGAKGKIKLPKTAAYPCPDCKGTKLKPGVVVPPMPLMYHESRELFEQLWAYCRQDVLTEAELSAKVVDLLPQETELYLLDQQINERGFQLDMGAVKTALSLVTMETPRLNAELTTLTKGEVTKATQRVKMLAWLASNGLHLENTQKDTINDALDLPGLSMATKRGLELMRMLGKSSTAKYKKMQDWMCGDGRVRGGLLFHGAGTGRWSGAGIQPQNFVKGFIKDMPRLWDVLKTKERSVIIPAIEHMSKGKCRDLLNALSQALRGVIISPPGRVLYVADYSSIEVCVLMWLADDRDAIEALKQGDIYCDMASTAYGYPVIANPDDQPPERQMGKIAILGLGYQMGAPKFVATCATWGVTITEEFSEQVVDAYRTKFWRVKEMWKAQEYASMQAVRTGRTQQCGRVQWFVQGGYLYCQLPRGRRLAYPEPEIRMVTTSWGAEKESLTFTGINPYNRKWVRRAAYGGFLVENITQAVARDIMAEAMTRCEHSGIYDIVLSVHDELISEAEAHEGSVNEYISILTELPAWAVGCPIKAAGWTGTRYHK